MFRQRLAQGIATGNLVLTSGAAVAVGEAILIACTTGSSTNVTSVTDSAGNTYTIDVQSASGTRRIAIISAPVTVALTTSTTITINTSGSANTEAAAYEYAALNLPADKTAVATAASGTSLATGSSGTLTQKSELIFTALGHSTGADTITDPSGYNDRPTGQTLLNVADLTVYDTTAVNLTWTWQTSGNAGDAVATYKRQPDQMFFGGSR